jgi:hypothetical protein
MEWIYIDDEEGTAENENDDDNEHEPSGGWALIGPWSEAA